MVVIPTYRPKVMKQDLLWALRQGELEVRKLRTGKSIEGLRKARSEVVSQIPGRIHKNKTTILDSNTPMV